MKTHAAKHIAALSVLALMLAARPAAADTRSSDADTAGQIKAHVHAILSGPDYRWQPEGESALGALARRAGTAVRNFIAWLRKRASPDHNSHVSPVMAQVLFWIVLIGLTACILVFLVLLVSHAVRTIRRRPLSSAKPRVSEIAEPADATSTDPGDWLALARQAAAAGDYRGAYRAAFLALLVALDRRGAIHWHRSRTNGDYLRDLRSAPDLHTTVRPLAHRFDAVWYGHVAAGPSDVDRCLEAAIACAPRPQQGAANA